MAVSCLVSSCLVSFRFLPGVRLAFVDPVCSSFRTNPHVPMASPRSRKLSQVPTASLLTRARRLSKSLGRTCFTSISRQCLISVRRCRASVSKVEAEAHSGPLLTNPRGQVCYPFPLARPQSDPNKNWTRSTNLRVTFQAPLAPLACLCLASGQWWRRARREWRAGARTRRRLGPIPKMECPMTNVGASTTKGPPEANLRA